MQTLRPFLAGVLVALVGLPSLSGAAEPSGAKPSGSIEDLVSCIRKNVPEPSSIRMVEITMRDRLGQERVTSANIYGRRSSDGSRRVLARVTKPIEMRGTTFLVIERNGESQLLFKSPELDAPRQITGAESSERLFGTDFSFGDFQRLHGLYRPGDSQRLEDQVVRGRSVAVIETKTVDAEESPYDRIVTYIDEKTCVALKTELYEPGDRLRKVLEIDPDLVVQQDSVWIPQEAVMRDLRTQSETRISVLSVDLGVGLSESMFELPSAPRPEIPAGR